MFLCYHIEGTSVFVTHKLAKVMQSSLDMDILKDHLQKKVEPPSISSLTFVYAISGRHSSGRPNSP